ncbi:Low temperature viability protein [Triangularia verruculosa]|uniref:Low temperature viability protein n=1 Tax=Triangularia verruculosa TaxID=2587418 RepID=A0AAN7B0U0_9PEZI|nr:Low temperature viability protein [Triangularia verruculosa]
MGKGKWIDKKTATHFTLVYRPQNDPLIHDDTAPSMVLAPSQPSKNAGKGKGLSDLASELGSDAASIRANEGEAANYGVYYDDTEYDYMQHLRDLGTGAGEAVFVEAPSLQKSKGKQKMNLSEALAKMDLEHKSEDLLDEEILPSKNLQRLTYQAQQDVPDSIAGFQPDMDPRLREVLEALEDEAYVDEDGGEDILKGLVEGDADELDELGDVWDDDEDDGWESDRTVKAAPTQKQGGDDEVPELVDTTQEEPSDDWMGEFKKFKDDQKSGTTAGVPKKKAVGWGATPSEIQSSIWTTTTNGGRQKKRKGALTNPSTYSMTSSSIYRTEQLNILDRRFEKLEEEYNYDEDDLASVSAVSTMSTVQGTTRQDFDNMLDEFLGEYDVRGKNRVKKGKWKNGVAEFDEIRKALGPPIIPAKYRTGGKS